VKVLLIRHAAAVPRGRSARRDHERPLTPRGRQKFRVAAKGLARIADRPDVLLTSPLIRARATAEIAAGAFKRLAPRIEPALAQERAEAVVAALQKHPRDVTIAIVGHEPTLSRLLARFLGVRRGDERLAFKKGGAALVDLPNGPAALGRLRWFVKPAILRSLGAD
jgi:phosphohistidine phosphatase